MDNHHKRLPSETNVSTLQPEFRESIVNRSRFSNLHRREEISKITPPVTDSSNGLKKLRWEAESLE
eukprot:scaffold271_cov69-Skeletonema_menzelii.AAC.1